MSSIFFFTNVVSKSKRGTVSPLFCFFFFQKEQKRFQGLEFPKENQKVQRFHITYNPCAVVPKRINVRVTRPPVAVSRTPTGPILQIPFQRTPGRREIPTQQDSRSKSRIPTIHGLKFQTTFFRFVLASIGPPVRFQVSPKVTWIYFPSPKKDWQSIFIPCLLSFFKNPLLSFTNLETKHPNGIRNPKSTIVTPKHQNSQQQQQP